MPFKSALTHCLLLPIGLALIVTELCSKSLKNAFQNLTDRSR